MAGEVTYVLTEADYATGARVAFLRSIPRWRTMRGWLFVICLALAVGMAVGWTERDAQARAIVIGLVLLWSLVTIPACWALGYLLIPRRTRRLYRQQASLSRPWTYRWTASALENSGADGAVTMPWHELHAWTHSRSTFLFYRNDALFHILPTRVLSPDQAADIDSLLIAHGVPRR